MTLNELKKIASRYGATIEKGGYDAYSQCWQIEVFAPDGKCWVGGTQVLIAYIFKYEELAKNRREAYEDLAERMSYGLEDFNE